MKLLNKNKGFTLVEVIVVLVIIGIMASIAVPALTGYIGKANDKKAIMEAQSVVAAARTVASQDLASGTPVTTAIASRASFKASVINMAGIPDSGRVEYSLFEDALLAELLYFNEGFYVLYRDGEFTVISSDEAASLIAAHAYTEPEAPPQPPPTPPATPPGFTDVRTIADMEERKIAIAENGRSILQVYNAIFLAQVSSFASEGLPTSADEWTKGKIIIGNSTPQYATFYKDGTAVASNVKIDIQLDEFNKFMAEKGLAGIVAWQAQVFYESTPSGRFSTVPSYVEFKNAALTGGTTNNDLWRYYSADGRIENANP